MSHNHTPRGSTMKCVRAKADKRIVRVRNNDALLKVLSGEFSYTTKSAYKAQERNHVARTA